MEGKMIIEVNRKNIYLSPLLIFFGIFDLFFFHFLYEYFDIFLIISGVFILITLLRNKTFEISNDGIYDKTKFINYGLIKWSDIDYLVRIKVNGVDTYIEIKLKDPDFFLKFNLWQRILTRMNSLNSASISIAAALLNIKYDNLFNILMYNLNETKSYEEKENLHNRLERQKKEEKKRIRVLIIGGITLITTAIYLLILLK
jgi:hypothetical protein